MRCVSLFSPGFIAEIFTSDEQTRIQVVFVLSDWSKKRAKYFTSYFISARSRVGPFFAALDDFQRRIS